MVIIHHPQEPNENEPGRYGRMIEFGGRSDGGRGYMAHSDRVGPGVLVLHEWFGLQEPFMRLADRLCAEGFTVLAPDLYDGAIAENVEQAEALAEALDPERTAKRLKAAAAFLVDNWHPRLGTIGFSLGAFWAAWLARNFPVEGTVMFYSVAEPSAENWHGPLQCHFAENDEFDSLEEARSFAALLQNGGVDIDVHEYPGTGHWFANPAVPDAFDPEAYELALSRTVGFLRHHLA